MHPKPSSSLKCKKQWLNAYQLRDMPLPHGCEGMQERNWSLRLKCKPKVSVFCHPQH